jgi:hypothetical protein
MAVNYGTPRCTPSADQRASPGTVARFLSSHPDTVATLGLRFPSTVLRTEQQGSSLVSALHERTLV